MDQEKPGQHLLALKEAARRLNVHPATLRRWADNGDILVMVTPGGHRRFPVSEIERLSGEYHIDETSDEVGAHLVEVALERAREGIARQPDRSWLTELTEDERDHLRDMGHRVMSLLEQFVAGDDNGASLIAEAELMGQEYARNTRDVGMGLTVVLQAVTFFRDSIVDAAVSIPDAAKMDRRGRSRLMRRINMFLNTILISVAEAFEQ